MRLNRPSHQSTEIHHTDLPRHPSSADSGWLAGLLLLSVESSVKVLPYTRRNQLLLLLFVVPPLSSASESPALRPPSTTADWRCTMYYTAQATIHYSCLCSWPRYKAPATTEKSSRTLAFSVRSSSSSWWLFVVVVSSSTEALLYITRCFRTTRVSLTI